MSVVDVGDDVPLFFLLPLELGRVIGGGGGEIAADGDEGVVVGGGAVERREFGEMGKGRDGISRERGRVFGAASLKSGGDDSANSELETFSHCSKLLLYAAAVSKLFYLYTRERDRERDNSCTISYFLLCNSKLSQFVQCFFIALHLI